jgi:hypothetical protein
MIGNMFEFIDGILFRGVALCDFSFGITVPWKLFSDKMEEKDTECK